MGTASEWMQVLEYGGIFAVAMLLLDVIRDRGEVVTLPNLFGTAFGAFIVGMWDVFGWRVLRGAIAVLFWGVLLVGLGAGFVFRRARKRSEFASKLG
jgi:hypothetical protein